jgi:hypothetical protein
VLQRRGEGRIHATRSYAVTIIDQLGRTVEVFTFVHLYAERVPSVQFNTDAPHSTHILDLETIRLEWVGEVGSNWLAEAISKVVAVTALDMS